MSEFKPRGFAAMSAERRAEIASKGGKAAHEKGLAHRFTPAEGKAAGRKGGQATAKKRSREANDVEDLGRDDGDGDAVT